VTREDGSNALDARVAGGDLRAIRRSVTHEDEGSVWIGALPAEVIERFDGARRLEPAPLAP